MYETASKNQTRGVIADRDLEHYLDRQIVLTRKIVQLGNRSDASANECRSRWQTELDSIAESKEVLKSALERRATL